MDRALAVRAAALYLPAVLAMLLALTRPRHPRLFAAGLVSFAWSLPSLLAVQWMNLYFGWWQFHASEGLFRGMPVDLYLGWAVLWGVIPILAFRKTPVAAVIAVFFGLDLLLMPACRPVVELGPRWLVGEFVALALVLLPAQLLARWTLDDTRLYQRAALQVVAAGGVFVFLIPEVVFALRPGAGWSTLGATPSWLRGLELQAVAALAVLGVSAVQEFAQRGGGTPIPYDPPRRLVAGGLYRYIANPMQLSCTLVMLAWGAVLRNPWIMLGGAMSFIYSAGLAHWDEDVDLESRFGSAWKTYRINVRDWLPRWRPWHDPASPIPRLYVAESCGPCSEMRQWFAAHNPSALEIVAAEHHPTQDLRRMTYDPMDGSPPDQGVRAFARGLEHLHLGWAFAGACVRLPLIAELVQLLLDASGLGPRTIPRSCELPVSGEQ